MADEIRISAEIRTEFGKGASRRVRRAERVPAVMYEKGNEPVHLTLPGHALAMALRHENALITLDIDGKDQLVLPWQVQRDIITGFVEHVDFYMVKKGEKVVVDIPVYTTGEAGPETFVTIEAQTISVEAEATHIPESVEVPIDGMEPGTQVLAQELKLPAGVTYQGEPEDLIVNITQEASAEQVEAELEAAEEEAGIEREPSDDEAQDENSEEE
ncbi:50S ribosomal protein L25/general stress protein Ctc [Propioniferax innocua]|uniref:Large ribosomal subunit protein bL25 n=1 Tax=Propioniferax innocua TaxID=1753 RepID=A0A542ZC13_9ACTN|nr:50S ribosomal protein L25/general stress protein Ctc [Propioniferax innocua]TQL57898.1 LSU ribosomal protein L25P [Propioniferax innocua]